MITRPCYSVKKSSSDLLRLYASRQNTVTLIAPKFGAKILSMSSQPRSLVLASTSRYRRELLQRLGVPFEVCAPQVDETPWAGESAHTLVSRLAQAKAAAVAALHPQGLIIGSDQVALLNGKILGKPGNYERALEQLWAASGQTVQFLTGLCVLDAFSERVQVDVVPFKVHFRQLTKTQIERYLQREQPYDCAGSFKSEGLGIALFERLEGDDPAALIGLPLIRLIRMLEHAGMAVL